MHPKRRAEFFDIFVSCDLKYFFVKVLVGHENALGIIPTLRHLAEHSVEPFKLLNIGSIGLFHRKANGKALQGLHRQIVALDIVQRKVCDYRRPAGIGEDELLLLEHFQHLAHRRAAHIKVFGDLRIGYFLAGLELHNGYPVLQSFEYVGFRKRIFSCIRIVWKRHISPSIITLMMQL